MVHEVPNLLLLLAAMVAVSGDASGVIDDPNRFLPLTERSGRHVELGSSR